MPEYKLKRTSQFSGLILQLFFYIVLDVSFSKEEYQVSESNDSLQVYVCKNKVIGLNTLLVDFEVEVLIVAQTIEMANSSGIPLPSTVPEDNPYSPSRAGQ